MRIYQTIHKYPPHIPLFEKRIGINGQTDITFSELQKLLIEDGYASSYILQPALQSKTNEVFFTIWNYERLQFLWADEHGIESRDLSVIKKAQIDWYKPDVFYNHSAFCDNNFIKKYHLDNDIIKVCWYGIIQKSPMSFSSYDIRLSLHRPYINQWNGKGLKAYELQPSFVSNWKGFNNKDKEIDLLFYGQTYPLMFMKRNQMLEKLLALGNRFKIRSHLTFPTLWPFSNIPIIRDYFRYGFLSKYLKENGLPPVYGRTLYETIGNSKFTINGYTNFNKEFKSNMRLFEAIGCGSLLISEAGNYPEGFEDGKHYISYENSQELLQKIPDILSNYEMLKKQMQPYLHEIKDLYSKKNQWIEFKKVILDFKKNDR